MRLGNYLDAEQALLGYVDANFAEDRITRKSNTGYIFKLFGGTVSWVCKKQSVPAQSLIEAEIIALSEAAKETVALRSVLEFMDERQVSPTSVYVDNQSCISNIHTEGKSPLLKHIHCKYLFTKELIKKKIIQVIYCPSEETAADMLTKSLAAPKTKALAGMVGLSTGDENVGHPTYRQ